MTFAHGSTTLVDPSSGSATRTQEDFDFTMPHHNHYQTLTQTNADRGRRQETNNNGLLICSNMWRNFHTLNTKPRVKKEQQRTWTQQNTPHQGVKTPEEDTPPDRNTHDNINTTRIQGNHPPDPTFHKDRIARETHPRSAERTTPRRTPTSSSIGSIQTVSKR